MMGSALNITVWSYVEQIGIGVLTDDRTFGDPHEVTDAMHAEFLHIRAATGLSIDIDALQSLLAM
jgi:diacylglycerol O-acyltransferase / wax synthase